MGTHHLVGLVAKTSTPTAAGLGSIPAFAVGVVPGRVISADQKSLHWPATLPRAWRDRVSVGPGWTGVSTQ